MRMLFLNAISTIVLCVLNGVAVVQGSEGIDRDGVHTEACHDDAMPKSTPKKLRFEPNWKKKGDCGPLSLYLLMRLEGKDITVEDVEKVLHFDEQVGCSLQDIGMAADQLDFDREIRFVNPKDLRDLPFPLILHAEGSLELGTGHFFVIVGYSADKQEYYVFDTTEERLHLVDEKSILQKFSGYVLLPVRVGTTENIAGWAMICMGTLFAGIASFAYRYRSRG